MYNTTIQNSQAQRHKDQQSTDEASLLEMLAQELQARFTKMNIHFQKYRLRQILFSKKCKFTQICH